MATVKDWTAHVIKQAEIDKYLVDGKDFIDEEKIFEEIERARSPISNECAIFYKNRWK